MDASSGRWASVITDSSGVSLRAQPPFTNAQPPLSLSRSIYRAGSDVCASPLRSMIALVFRIRPTGVSSKFPAKLLVPHSRNERENRVNEWCCTRGGIFPPTVFVVPRSHMAIHTASLTETAVQHTGPSRIAQRRCVVFRSHRAFSAAQSNQIPTLRTQSATESGDSDFPVVRDRAAARPSHETTTTTTTATAPRYNQSNEMG